MLIATSSAATAGKLIIAGGIITLIAGVAVIASITPEYKDLQWDDIAQTIALVLGVPGVCLVFAGTALEITAKSITLIKFETFGAAIVALSVVIAFALPIAKRAKEKRAAARERYNPTDASPK